MYGIVATVEPKVGGIQKQIRLEGYKDYSSMRRGVKVRMANKQLLMVKYYEFCIDKNGFRIVNKFRME